MLNLFWFMNEACWRFYGSLDVAPDWWFIGTDSCLLGVNIFCSVSWGFWMGCGLIIFDFRFSISGVFFWDIRAFFCNEAWSFYLFKLDACWLKSIFCSCSVFDFCIGIFCVSGIFYFSTVGLVWSLSFLFKRFFFLTTS